MEATTPAAVIVLAAGAGTRMKSAIPKILHEIAGRSLVGHAIAAAQGLQPERLVAVVRFEREVVVKHLLDIEPAITIADQDGIPGTGRAVQVGLDQLPGDLAGTVLVTYGDVPLLTTELIGGLVAAHESECNAVTVLTAELADATGYGRIVRSADGAVEGIVEHKDATTEQLAINEVNSGIYAFDAEVLRNALASVTTENAQGEMYLTDVLGIARNDGGRVAAMVTSDRWQVEGANDRAQLSSLGKEMNRRILETWMRAGVTIIDPQTTWVDASVALSPDVTIKPGTQLHGSTAIGTGSVIGPDSTLTDTQVGQNAVVKRSDVTSSIIAAGASVGPFAYLRPGTNLGEAGKIGAFYETKNVTVGRGSKLSHLGYAGDADIGEYSNIGCGNITANYDGVKKHRTVIGSHVRTSSNTVFIAPVTIGDGAYTGAGAIVRKDVPAGALALSVAPQQNREGWTAAKRPGSAAAEAASHAGRNTDPNKFPATD